MIHVVWYKYIYIYFFFFVHVASSTCEFLASLVVCTNLQDILVLLEELMTKTPVFVTFSHYRVCKLSKIYMLISVVLWPIGNNNCIYKSCNNTFNQFSCS